MTNQIPLNIISLSVNDKAVSGPQKVVKNTIKGLKEIDYPFEINAPLNYSSRIWVHDNPYIIPYLYKLKANVLLGPNIFVKPNGLLFVTKSNQVGYLLNSTWTFNWWNNHYNNSPPINLYIWPAGIEIANIKNINNRIISNPVLLYHKQRDPRQLNSIRDLLNSLNIKFNTIIYGQYKEEEYFEYLMSCSLIIWHGRQESQGIALQEALGYNVPIIVLDAKSLFDTFSDVQFKFNNKLRNICTTSAPFFDKRCGIIIDEISELPNAIDEIRNNYKNYEPREFILENLAIRKQALELIEIFKYLELSKESGKISKKHTKNSCLMNPKSYFVWGIIFKTLRKLNYF